jgi:hypothetical protein
VAGIVWISEHDNVDVAAERIKPMIALYVGGMGARNANFHRDVFVRMGWGEVCEHVQTLYADGRKDEAARAIPLEMVEDVALVGPVEKICAEIRDRWGKTCLTTLILGGVPRQETLARVVEAAGSVLVP